VRILLFDMDGVLIESHAYYMALRDTVEQISRALGFEPYQLTRTQVEWIEAAGLTAEWDSSAVCTAMFLERLWKIHPSFQFPIEPPYPTPPDHDLPPPDIDTFIRKMAEEHFDAHPLVEAERRLLEQFQLDSAHTHRMRKILREARNPAHSLTFRLFQEYMLGSEMYTAIFNLPAHLETASYLEQLDRPTLTNASTERLNAWLDSPGNYAAIITNRPSLWPEGNQGPPEAEFGARLCGLDRLPILGYGELSWLSARRAAPSEKYLKPSALHALAAMRAALGEKATEALVAAASVMIDGEWDSAWETLAGAEVYVFEDSAKGMQSASAACDILGEHGVKVHLELLGITQSKTKEHSLQAAGARVYPSLHDALEAADGYFSQRPSPGEN
jgi:phosphoglycolate phosphatase-like HAD superfamily hydrolase